MFGNIFSLKTTQKHHMLVSKKFIVKVIRCSITEIINNFLEFFILIPANKLKYFHNPLLVSAANAKELYENIYQRFLGISVFIWRNSSEPFNIFLGFLGVIFQNIHRTATHLKQLYCNIFQNLLQIFAGKFSKYFWKFLRLIMRNSFELSFNIFLNSSKVSGTYSKNQISAEKRHRINFWNFCESF